MVSTVSTASYVSSIVLLRTGLFICLGMLVRARVFVSCMPPSSTTSSENVGVGAMVTRESFLSIDFGVGATAAAFGASAFSKSAGSPVCPKDFCAVSSKSCADLGSTDFGSCTKLFTESGTGNESTSFVICADRPFIDVIIVPILPNSVVFPAASAASSSFVLLPVAIPGGVLTPSAPRKFNAPLRRMAFVPITTPMRPTKPSDTAPRIMPREELSAAAATAIGIVAFNDGDALRFEKKLGPGVPEKVIVFIEEGEKLPDTDIDIERVGEIDREFDILFVNDKDGLAVLPGEGETVVLVVCVLLIEEEKD